MKFSIALPLILLLYIIAFLPAPAPKDSVIQSYLWKLSHASFDFHVFILIAALLVGYAIDRKSGGSKNPIDEVKRELEKLRRGR